MGRIIKIKKLTETAQIPKQGSEIAAGWDLYANIDYPVAIAPHTTSLIGTGLAMEIPNNFWGGIYARSGLATKMGLRPANCTGVIDSDYRGQVKVALHNDTDETVVVNNGERIAQFILMPKFDITFTETDKLSDTKREAGGFGSTGMR